MSSAGLADEDDRLVRRQGRGVELRQRMVDRTGHMAGRIFVRLAHVDDMERARGAAFAECVVIHWFRSRFAERG